VPPIKLHVAFRKIFPHDPHQSDRAKELAATAAWLAEPPSRRGFALVGVFIESSAVEPTIRTLMQF
jgi:hypothetical protein